MWDLNVLYIYRKLSSKRKLKFNFLGRFPWWFFTKICSHLVPGSLINWPVFPVSSVSPVSLDWPQEDSKSESACMTTLESALSASGSFPMKNSSFWYTTCEVGSFWNRLKIFETILISLSRNPQNNVSTGVLEYHYIMLIMILPNLFWGILVVILVFFFFLEIVKMRRIYR